MSSCWKKPSYSLRQQEKNWINLTFAAHDQFCHCDDPWEHLLIILNKDSNAPKPESEVRNIKWLLIGKPTGEEDPTDPTTEDTGFLDGELERLFDETNGTDDGAVATTR